MTDAPECKNDSATCTGIDAGLTQPRSGFDLETTRRDLIAMRLKHGADSKIGMRCSNVIEQLQNILRGTGDRWQLLDNLPRQMADLERLTAEASAT